MALTAPQHSKHTHTDQRTAEHTPLNMCTLTHIHTLHTHIAVLIMVLASLTQWDAALTPAAFSLTCIGRCVSVPLTQWGGECVCVWRGEVAFDNVANIKS